jgi:23S rRNA pseudouridine1911/1915/1917 synthase
MTEPGAANEVEIVVPPDMDGHRADRVVAGTMDISRAAARLAVDSGQVVVDGAPVGPSDKLRGGTRLVVTLPEEPAGLVPWDQPLAVRYESAAVLVIDKPPGLVVHPGAGHRNDTLANVLIFRFPELAELGEEHRWGLVHRLDRETSGLLIVARTGEVHSTLQAQLKRREISRVYLTLVHALIDPVAGAIEAPIGRDPEHPTRMTLRQGGRFAKTHYRRLAAWEDVSLLEVRLETGRTHQIRVHMSSIGAPVVGDKTYGLRRSTIGNPGRVWLHASRLTFIDPVTSVEGNPVTVRSPLPADLRASLRNLGEPLIGVIPADATDSAPL